MRTDNYLPLIAFSLLLPCTVVAETIDINIGLEAEGAVTPQENVKLIQGTVVSSLENQLLSEEGLSDTQQLLLNAFNNVSLVTTTDSEKNTFYNAVSAKKNATSSNVTRKIPAAMSISGISKRLSALRNQTKRNSFSQRMNKKKKNGSTSLPLIFNQTNDDVPGGLLDQRLSGFVTGNYIVSKQSETSTESGFDGSTQQFTAGADYRINNQTFAGLALGMVNGGIDIKNNGGTLNNKAVTLLGYGSYNIKPNWYVDGTVNSGARFFDMNRAITFTLSGTPTNTSACSKPDSQSLGFSLGTGYDKTFKNGHTLAALASFNYTNSTIDSFVESGCNGAIPYSLVVSEQKITSKMFNIGGQWSQPISTDFGILIPQFSVNWVKELEDKRDAINAYFSNDPGKTTMSFKSGNKDLSFVNVKFAVSVVLPRGISGFLQYETQQFVDDYQQYTISVGARKEF